MSNGKASDLQFRYQRPATGIYRVGPVGSKMLFTSIQAAINQAVADGFTSALTPATVEIYPGTYIEDLTLASGVHLRGVGSGLRTTNEIEIDGLVTYSPVAGTINDNVVNIDTIAIHPSTASKKALVFSGTAPARLNLRKCVMQSASAAGGTTGLVTVSNSGSGSTCRFTDSTFQAVLATDTEVLQLSGSAFVEVYGGQGGLVNQSVGTIATGVSVAGSVTLNIRLPSFVSGAFTQIFTLSSATAVIQLDKTLVQNTLAGGHIFNATAAGNIRCRHAGLFTANLAGKICNASAAVNLNLHNCDFNGSSQAAPFAAIDTIVNSFGNGTYNMQQDQAYKEFQVGRGIGYQTIQAAITAAAATGVGNRKVVKIPPGTYVENLTLADNVDLVADTWDDMAEPTTLSPVNILGAHTYTPAAGTIRFKGIIFQSAGNASPLFTYAGGAGAGTSVMRFYRCRLVKVFGGAANMFTCTFAGVGGSASIVLDQCSLSYQVTSGVMIDLSGSINSSVSILGNIASTNSFSPAILLQPTAPGTPTALPLVATSPSGSTVLVSDLAMSVDTTELFRMNGNSLLFLERCKIQQSVIEGTLVKLYSGSFSNYISECTIEQNTGPSPNGLPCLVRDNGTQAQGTITIDTQPADGDFVTINGTRFTARTVPTTQDDFAIGATTTDTATNLRNAINLSTDIGNDASSGVLALIYAQSALNVVTVKSFGDAAGNAYTLDSSVPLVMIPSGATLAGGIDGAGGTANMGVNSISGVIGATATGGGGCVIALPVAANQRGDATLNQPQRDAIVVQLDGVDQHLASFKPATKWLNFTGDGVDVDVDLANNSKANVTIPGSAQANEFIVGPGKGQYSTIQAAIDAAHADIAAGRKVVAITPGQYIEDLTLYTNVDLVARSFDFAYQNGGPVQVQGVHTLTPIANGGYVQISNIFFMNLSVPGSMFEIANSAFNQNQLIFKGCYFYKNENEATPMFAITNTQPSSQMLFMGCAAGCNTDSGAMFECGVGTITWYGPMYDSVFAYDLRLGPSTLVTSLANLATVGAAGLFQLIKSKVYAQCNEAIDLQDSTAVARFKYSEVLSLSDDGCVIKYSAAGLAEMLFDKIGLLGGSGNSALIARDSGVQASGSITIDTQPTGGNNASATITVASNPAPGDTVTVNGTVLTAVAGAPVGPQFQIGGTTDITAANIAQAVDNNIGNIDGSALLNVVTVTSRASGTAGNAFTLASSVPLVLIPSGATFAGGTNGDTVTINGVVFVATNGTPYQTNNEFQVGATVDDTADNLRDALNSSGVVGIFKVIYARTTTNVVTITARKSGVAGNAITLASSVPLVMIPSGATLTGGTAGVGGQFVYSTLAMEFINDIQNTITLTAYATGVAAV